MAQVYYGCANPAHRTGATLLVVGHNDLVSSRVRSADSGAMADEVERMLAGSGAVLALADPSRPAGPIDESALPDGFTGALVPTSGSTGAPKTVMLSRRALLAAARAASDRLGGPGSWANPLPPWYVAGLMTRVRAAVAGRSCVEVSPHLEDLPRPQGRAYVSLVPAQLHRALSQPEICRNLTSYAAVLIGGAALDGALRARAEQAGITVVTTYGASETCGGVVYDGVPLDGVTIRLIDQTEEPSPVECREMSATGDEKRTYGDIRGLGTTGAPPPAAVGRIQLDTPTLFDGYLGDPEGTARVRTATGFLTNDRGRLVDGRLRVLGRVDDVVQSGGKNVDLSEVQRLLDEAFPHQTACFAKPDPVWGATVLVASTGPGLDEIWARLRPSLDSAARPRGILCLDELPRTSSGKIDREALTQMWRNNGERA